MGHPPWSYRRDHIGPSPKRQQETHSRCRQEMSLGILYRILWEHPQDVTLRHPQDVIFQCSNDVGKERPQVVAGDVLWRYIENHMGTSIGRLFGTFSGRPRDVILTSGMHMKRVFKLPLLEFT